MKRDLSCTHCRLTANPAYTGLDGRTSPQRRRFELHSLQAAGQSGIREQARNEGDSSCTRCRLPEELGQCGTRGPGSRRLELHLLTSKTP